VSANARHASPAVVQLEQLLTVSSPMRLDGRRAQALRVLEDESLSFDLQRSQTDLEALVYPPAYRKTASIDPRAFSWRDQRPSRL
jgi:hypothetical protein